MPLSVDLYSLHGCKEKSFRGNRFRAFKTATFLTRSIFHMVCLAMFRVCLWDWFLGMYNPLTLVTYYRISTL